MQTKMEQPETSKEEDSWFQCAATTKAGRRCRKSSGLSGWCHCHEAEWSKKPRPRCEWFVDPDNVSPLRRCPRPVYPGQRYCSHCSLELAAIRERTARAFEGWRQENPEMWAELLAKDAARDAQQQAGAQERGR